MGEENIERVLGEISATCRATQQQVTELFALVREVREHGCVIGNQHTHEITQACNRLTAVERQIGRAMLAAALIAGAVIGLDRVLQWIAAGQ